MNIESLVVGTFQVNCFILWGAAQQAIVIDPGEDADRIAAFLDQKQLSVAAYMLTHGHMDHLSALATLASDFPAPVGLHPADSEWAFTDVNQMPPYYGVPAPPPALERKLVEAQSWSDGGLDYTVLETPGHTPGGVCFLFHADTPLLFTGDTLFAGSAGRTDLPSGDSRQLTTSLRRLRQLDDAIRVFPGHGPATNIGREKQNNPFMS